jgi:RNA polymerase sigma factor (sigma-70 family)
MNMRSLSLRGFALRRLDDESVLERAREGQEAAFAELYRRFHSMVYGYCMARLLDIQAAEDVTQDAFLRVARAAEAPEQVRSARAWMLTVARSAVIDYTRRQKRLPNAVPVEEVPDTGQSESAADGALQREDARVVFLALSRLRPRYRSALILREMHALSSAEIGETLGMKSGAVDTLLCRARDAFGRQYAEVSDLAEECKRGVELIYRERGSGVTDSERDWLRQHVAVCPRCARERGLAEDPRRLAALLPLFGMRAEGVGLFTRAMEVLGSAPASFEALGLSAAKVTAVAVAAAVATAPVVARVTRPKAVTPVAARPTLPVANARAVEPSGSVAVETTAPVAAEATRVVAGEPTATAAGNDDAKPSSGTPTPTPESDGHDSAGSDEPTPAPVVSVGDTGYPDPETPTTTPTDETTPPADGDTGVEGGPESGAQPPLDDFSAN